MHVQQYYLAKFSFKSFKQEQTCLKHYFGTFDETFDFILFGGSVHTGMVKKVNPRLRELTPTARVSQDAGSRYLGPIFLTDSVHVFSG